MKGVTLFIVFIIVLSLITSNRALAQDTLSNLRMVFIPDAPINFTESDTVDNPLALADTLIYKVGFDITSTDDIAKIHVKMGTALATGNLVNTFFVPGASASPPLAYSEADHHITLTTGMFDFFPEVYLEIWFEYDDQSTSEIWALSTVE